jgi:acyl-CoA synthetase (AMP-forming)/AMP-acid ligase II
VIFVQFQDKHLRFEKKRNCILVPTRKAIVLDHALDRPALDEVEEEILDFCRKNLAKYKVPTQVEFRQALPKASSRKILRRILRQEEIKKGSGKNYLESRLKKVRTHNRKNKKIRKINFIKF